MSGWTPETGCHGKRTFLNKRDAKVMSRLVSDKNVRFQGQRTHVYKCPSPKQGGCGYFHVGHPIGLHSQEDAA